MSGEQMNQHVVLAARPQGAPQPSDFRVVERPIPELADGEVLIENLFISLDAGFRHWMDEGSGDHVLPEMQIDEPVMGLILGIVRESRKDDVAVGRQVMARLAWEKYSVTDATDFLVQVPEEYDCPPNWHLGILGDTGMSAYFGLTDIGQPQPGETVVVSAAGGGVGSVAGQIAKIAGARTVGLASGPEKCQRLIDELGYDTAVDRTVDDVAAALAAACPDGIDVYFDSVGGPLLEMVLDQINPKARIALCGSVSAYSATGEVPGPSNLFQLTTNQAKMQGFMTFMNLDRYPEARRRLLDWVEAGQLTNVEYMQEGIDKVGPAFCDLFAGRNFGKTIVKL